MKAVRAVEVALAGVDAELAAHAEGRGSVSNEPQLARFREVLEEMSRQLASGDLPPRSERAASTARVIADAWPFDSDLAGLILRAENAYRDA